MKVAELSGLRRPHFTVIGPGKKNKWGAQFWKCRCECGNTFSERSYLIASGRRESCGCLKGGRNLSHGMSRTAEYNIWNGARDRCRNPKNKNFDQYGGRGILFAWDSFEEFIKDMGPRPSAAHSIDRIDVDGNYEPGNCRWATAREQCNNKRNNVIVRVNGGEVPLAEYLGTSECTQYIRVLARLRNGWSMADAIFQPRRVDPVRRNEIVA